MANINFSFLAELELTVNKTARKSWNVLSPNKEMISVENFDALLKTKIVNKHQQVDFSKYSFSAESINKRFGA